MVSKRKSHIVPGAGIVPSTRAPRIAQAGKEVYEAGSCDEGRDTHVRERERVSSPLHLGGALLPCGCLTLIRDTRNRDAVFLGNSGHTRCRFLHIAPPVPIYLGSHAA